MLGVSYMGGQSFFWVTCLWRASGIMLMTGLALDARPDDKEVDDLSLWVLLGKQAQPFGVKPS